MKTPTKKPVKKPGKAMKTQPKAMMDKKKMKKTAKNGKAPFPFGKQLRK